ncbi:hypothetical protein [uncultured Fusobacterium sp.]|uniref:hypothetical protein n=1 Tax=uncultured Fusobacterium sp. TaxID=159267 RepID=UPI0025F97AA0|nr:hypothetical protein [uncultured Fusobacterium sp.]
MDYKKFILEELIIPVYQNLIDCEEFIPEEFEISLPLFLNTGDAVDIIIDFKNKEKIILKNRLHLLVEDALREKINFITLRKNYILGNEKIKNIEKIYLTENEIASSLLQEKIIDKGIANDKLKEEIFKYIFSVVRYYNYIYDYIVINLKAEDKKKIFSEEIKKFVDSYNKKNSLNFIKIDKSEEKNSNLASENNDYYISKEELLTGVNDKVHFLEAIRDIEILKKEYKIKNFIIVQDEKGKNGLTEKYMRKFIIAKFEYINNNLEIEFKENKNGL